MAVIDLTLESFWIPAIPNYDTYRFGTKKQAGGLSTQEVNDNIMMPWERARPIEITDISTTKASGDTKAPVQADCSFVFTAGQRVSFTLDDADYVGCCATFYNTSAYIQDVRTLNSTDPNSPVYDSHTVHPNCHSVYIWTGSQWIREENYGIGIPIGAVEPYSGVIDATSTPPVNPPHGWLLCDGSEFLIADYPDLYATVGNIYGTASDADHFKLPDGRESALVGAGQSDNDYDAETNPTGIVAHDVFSVGQFKDDCIQDHTHKPNGLTGGRVHYGRRVGDCVCEDDISTHDTGGVRTGRTGTVTRGKRLGVNFIIKY